MGLCHGFIKGFAAGSGLSQRKSLLRHHSAPCTGRTRPVVRFFRALFLPGVLIPADFPMPMSIIGSRMAQKWPSIAPIAIANPNRACGLWCCVLGSHRQRRSERDTMLIRQGNDNGTISPTAALSSFPYAPEGRDGGRCAIFSPRRAAMSGAATASLTPSMKQGNGMPTPISPSTRGRSY